MKKVLLSIVLLATLTGCNGSKKDKDASTTPAQTTNVNPEEITGAIYQGKVDGCKVLWDPFYCGTKSNTLNSNVAHAIFRDKDGNTIILDKNQTNVIYGILEKDKVWHNDK